MAAKAKLSLSQLFRRTSNNNSTTNETVKSEHSSGGIGCEVHHAMSNHASATSASNRKMSGSSSGGTVSSAGGKKAYFEHAQKQEIMKVRPQHKSPGPSSMDSSQNRARQQQQQQQQQNQPAPPHQQVQQQLQGILKKSSCNGTELVHGGGLGGRTHRSSLQRSKSNPNPSSNPLKEVSWSCPTLEKRREVILNYFERIILENKQEQHVRNKGTIKPNIPCEGGNGEPIYEEILDLSGLPPPSQFMNLDNGNNRTGSLKPKLGPKKVRMNIPQDHQNQQIVGNGQSPIYDKVLSRSHSMLESSSASVSSSSVYDIAPSSAASISSSGSHSLYENFLPSAYYAPSSSSESDYGTVGGGGYDNEFTCNGNNGKMMTTRIAGRSHSFHDNYRTSGSYNIQAPQNPLVDTDQLYAKVCKRKKLKVTTDQSHQQQQQQLQPNHQRPLSYSTAKADCNDEDENNHVENGEQLRVQVSCGNVVTMIPVIMPCSSSFSTSCLSLSSSSDNNNDDMTITTSISNVHSRNNHNGLLQYEYESEKTLPDKHIAYINNKNGGGGDCDASSPRMSAAIRNRNNLSVIHLLAAYDPAKEIEEFIPSPSSFTAIIDSTESAPKSISVPVRVNFSSLNSNSNNNNNNNNSSSTTINNNNKNNEDVDPYSSSRQPLMVTNCSFGYDNDAFEDDDDGNDEGDNNHHHKNLSSSGTSSTSGADDGDDGSSRSASATSDSDTDEDDHHAQKYSFTSNDGRGVLNHHHHHRVKKSITFQDETTTTKDLLLLTTSESEDDEELCEHKSLIDMNNSTKVDPILDDSSGKGDKYMSLMDDEDRGFDSFLDDSEHTGSGGSPSSFRSENLRNQLTFAQMSQDVPPEQLKKKATSVLDLINSEISDLHMRELELKQLHSPPPPSGKGDDDKHDQEGSAEEEFEEGSSGEDDFSDSAIEYDGFTTNGSHSSGQVSPSENLSDMISHHQNEVPRSRQMESSNLSKRVHDDAADEDEQKRGHQEGNKRTEVKVRPLEDEEDRSIKFLMVSGETPIEREIRLTREREDEFRRQNHPYLAVCPPAPASKGTMSLPVVKTRDVSSRPESQAKPQMPSFPLSPSAAADKHIQMEMATARFKKEIEESMKREKELIQETRQKKREAEDEENDEEATPQIEEEQQKVEQLPQKPVAPVAPQQPTPPVTTTTTTDSPENQIQLRKPTLAKLPIAKLPAARFFAPPAFNANKPSRITPVISPIISKGSLGFPSSSNNNNVVGGSLPVGIGSRPSYTSFEKYILQTSMNYMANKQNNTEAQNSPNSANTEEPVKNLVGTDPGVVNKHIQFNIPEDPLRIIQKPAGDDEQNEGEEDEKPKRKYIPAQDKIHKEIQELAMREKELNHTRAKWKSTLDLPEALKDAEEEKEPLRRTTSTTQSSLSLNAASSASRDNISTITIGAEGQADQDTTSTGESDNLNLVNVTSEDVRQVTRVKNPARRRHSLLINQWEERIRQQQQQNSKK